MKKIWKLQRVDEQPLNLSRSWAKSSPYFGKMQKLFVVKSIFRLSINSRFLTRYSRLSYDVVKVNHPNIGQGDPKFWTSHSKSGSLPNTWQSVDEFLQWPLRREFEKEQEPQQNITAFHAFMADTADKRRTLTYWSEGIPNLSLWAITFAPIFFNILLQMSQKFFSVNTRYNCMLKSAKSILTIILFVFRRHSMHTNRENMSTMRDWQ